MESAQSSHHGSRMSRGVCYYHLFEKCIVFMEKVKTRIWNGFDGNILTIT